MFVASLALESPATDNFPAVFKVAIAFSADIPADLISYNDVTNSSTGFGIFFATANTLSPINDIDSLLVSTKVATFDNLLSKSDADFTAKPNGTAIANAPAPVLTAKSLADLLTALNLRSIRAAASADAPPNFDNFPCILSKGAENLSTAVNIELTHQKITVHLAVLFLIEVEKYIIEQSEKRYDSLQILLIKSNKKTDSLKSIINEKTNSYKPLEHITGGLQYVGRSASI